MRRGSVGCLIVAIVVTGCSSDAVTGDFSFELTCRNRAG